MHFHGCFLIPDARPRTGLRPSDTRCEFCKNTDTSSHIIDFAAQDAERCAPGSSQLPARVLCVNQQFPARVPSVNQQFRSHTCVTLDQRPHSALERGPAGIVDTSNGARTVPSDGARHISGFVSSNLDVFSTGPRKLVGRNVRKLGLRANLSKPDQRGAAAGFSPHAVKRSERGTCRPTSCCQSRTGSDEKGAPPACFRA
jgi:hypothetical protein